MSNLNENDKGARESQETLLRTLAEHNVSVPKVIPFQHDDVPQFISRLEEFHNESKMSTLITK
jgi:hypothetical protein